MTTKTKHANEAHKELVGEMLAYGRQLLETEIVMALELFEDKLLDQFRDKLDMQTKMIDRNGNARKRSRAENMTDWVKTQLPLDYFKIGKCRYILLRPETYCFGPMRNGGIHAEVFFNRRDDASLRFDKLIDLANDLVANE